MNKYMMALMGLILALVLTIGSPVQAVFVKESCLNATHLELTYEYQLITDGASSLLNYTQIHHCTNNCTLDKCLGMFDEGDITSVWVIAAIGGILLILGTWLGIPRADIPETTRTGLISSRDVAKYLFFFAGFYLMFLSLGTASRMGSMYGSDANVTRAMNTAVMVINWILYMFLFIFVLEFAASILKWMDNLRKSEMSGRRFGRR